MGAKDDGFDTQPIACLEYQLARAVEFRIGDRLEIQSVKSNFRFGEIAGWFRKLCEGAFGTSVVFVELYTEPFQAVWIELQLLAEPFDPSYVMYVDHRFVLSCREQGIR